MKKRILSIVLALLLVVLNIPAMADEVSTDANAFADYLSLISFNDGDASSIQSGALLSTKAYGNGVSSAYYNFDTAQSFVALLDNTVGDAKALAPTYAERPNAKIKIRFYSESVGSKFTVTLRSGGGGITKSYEVPIAGFGWQEYGYDFATFISGLGEGVDKQTHLEISASESGAGSIYVDDIWFQRELASTEAADAPSGDGILVLDSLSKKSETSTAKAYATTDCTTNLRPGGAPSYTMVTITGAYPDFQWDLKAGGKNVDITGGTYADSSVTTALAYNYLNMWVYSPRPQNGGLGVAFNGKGSGMAGGPVVFDWTGWKLISIPTTGADIKSSGLTMRALLTCGQYLGGSAFRYVDETFAKNNSYRIPTTWNNWKNEGQFGIETIWLSKTQPSGANVSPNPTLTQKETPVPAEYDDWVVYDVAENINSVDINRTAVVSGNGHFYTGSLRTNDGILGQRRIDLTYAADNKTITTAKFVRTGDDQYPGLYGTKTYAEAKSIINEGYKYANLWIYSPGVSYDQFGNYSEYILTFNVFTSETAHERIGVGIPANWTGWKLVSVPLDEMAEANPTYYEKLKGGLRRVEIIANNAQFCNDWKANGAVVAAENLKPDFGDTNAKTNLSRAVDGEYDFGIDGQGDFNTFSDLKSFVEVERCWFSKEIPAGASEVNLDLTSDTVTIENKVIKGYAGMTLAELRDVLTFDSNVELIFKTESGEVISDESQLATKGMIAVVSCDDLMRSYILDCELLEIENVKLYMNGEETSSAFDIGTLEAKTYAVCYNKVIAEDVTLILAQYEGDKLINIDFTTEAVSGKKEITASINLEKVADTTLSVFLWNSMSGITPIKEPVKLDIGNYLWMPSIFASGSVMQRDADLAIWGEASPGAEITVALGGSTHTTVAKDDGTWNLTADPINVEGNPYTMTVTSSTGASLEFTDILAGEVWLCSGQSNMEWQMYRIVNEGAYEDIKAQVSEDIANSANSNIRLYNQSRNYTTFELKDTKDGSWQACDSSSVNNFSAVAYYFGKQLEADLGVPVGLISAAYGGTPIQCFIDNPTREANNINYIHATDPLRYGGSVFNSMVAPIIPYSIKGVLWYQGCSNSNSLHDTSLTVDEDYYNLQNIWLQNWRSRWDDADMPFVITQIAAMNTADYQFIRDAQYRFATTNENVEMAVTYDIGEKTQVHYCNKITAGYRLALAAEGGVYGMDVDYKYPSPESFTVDGTALTLTFKDVYDGLKLKDGDTTLNSFEILTANGTWVQAKAEITGPNTVTVTDGTNTPVGVRAGFKPYAEPMYNLYNSADLLATPFRLTK